MRASTLRGSQQGFVHEIVLHEIAGLAGQQLPGLLNGPQDAQQQPAR